MIGMILWESMHYSSQYSLGSSITRYETSSTRFAEFMHSSTIVVITVNVSVNIYIHTEIWHMADAFPLPHILVKPYHDQDLYDAFLDSLVHYDVF
jgi:hypothetical protein